MRYGEGCNISNTYYFIGYSVYIVLESYLSYPY